MQVRIFHVADVHLGNEQYHLPERSNDFALAFQHVIHQAIDQRVNAVVVAGDIFHRRAIDPMVMGQATMLFRQLRNAGIPAIVIEGNHDKAYFRDGGYSWLAYLHQLGEIILLSPQFAQDSLIFAAEGKLPGELSGYYDIPRTGIRVYGVPWMGSQTGHVLEMLRTSFDAMREQEQYAGVRYRLLMLHTGVEGEMPAMHGLPDYSAFRQLKDCVDYIALGHVHKPYAFDNWLFNPGSLETNSIDETTWERGYYDVTVTIDTQQAKHAVQHVITPKRAFARWQFPVDGYPATDVLLAEFARFCQRHEHEARALDLPVIEVKMRGYLGFDQSALDWRSCEEIVRQYADPLHVIIRNVTQSAEAAAPDAEDAFDRTTLQELEFQVLREMLDVDSRFVARTEDWARVLVNIKRHALDQDSAADIAQGFRETMQRLT